MAVAFLLFFCPFALVFTAFCLFLAVPLVRFSTLLSPFLFFPNSYLGSSGVFSPDYLRCDPVQLQRQVPGKVPVQRLGEVLQGSGADT